MLGLGSTFTDYGPANATWHLVGLANYRAVLGDADLRVAFGNVCVFAFGFRAFPFAVLAFSFLAHNLFAFGLLALLAGRPGRRANPAVRDRLLDRLMEPTARDARHRAAEAVRKS